MKFSGVRAEIAWISIKVNRAAALCAVLFIYTQSCSSVYFYLDQEKRSSTNRSREVALKILFRVLYKLFSSVLVVVSRTWKYVSNFFSGKWMQKD